MNINTNYFTTGSLSATNEQKYLISSMRIADRLRQEFASGPGFFPVLSVWKGFKIYRHNYPGLTKLNCFSFKPLINFVFIRPNNTIPRRCILLTNGAGEDLGNKWNGTLLLAANLVMRGYAVVIYENFVSANGVAHLVAANGSAWKYPCGTNTPCLLTDSDSDKFRKLVYSGVQCGVAALQTIMDNTNNSSVTNVDTSKIYAMGASFGGITSIAFANADNDSIYGNINFSNSMFNAMGGFTNISRWPSSRYKNVIKAVACFGGGTIINDTVVGNLFDNKDAPVIFFHALKDSFCTIDSSKNLMDLGDGRNTYASLNYLGGPAKQDVIQSLQNNNIKYNVYVNCDNYSAHSFGSAFGQSSTAQSLYDFSSIKSLTDAQILNIYSNPSANPSNTASWKRYMYVGFQFLDFTKYACDFFNKVSTNPSSISNEAKYVIPTTIRNANPDANKDFFPPASNIGNLIPNGRYINSPTTCISIPLTTRSNTLRKAKTELSEIKDNKDELFSDKLLLFPNPATGLINISFNVEVKGNVTIRVFDVKGNIIDIISENEPLQNGSYSKVLNTAKYTNGIYYVTFSNNESYSTKSFTIIK
ncbi:MAG: T9SS type A sorting domain-containing protein [Chitinophagales bacterium]